MDDDTLENRVREIRSFNRFYTQQIGVLTQGLLRSSFSLTEVRILLELSHESAGTARELVELLGLDSGYVSRILQRFEQTRLIERVQSKNDGRQRLIKLTLRGRKAFRALNQRASDEIRGILERLEAPDQERLTAAMRTIRAILESKGRSRTFVIRPYGAGDIGYVTHRVGLLAEELGLPESTEARVGQALLALDQRRNLSRECLWIAEESDRIVGAAAIVERDRRVAELSVFYFEPAQADSSIAHKLLQECRRVARRAGYSKVIADPEILLCAFLGLLTAAGFEPSSAESDARWVMNLTHSPSHA